MSYKAILVVDDDEDVRQAMKEALELEGHKVYTANNGLEAIQFLITEKISEIGVIILDLMMPGMTGAQFLQVVQEKHPEIAKIPVVLATAKGSVGDENLSGLSSRIRKPFELEELCNVVNQFI